MTGPTPPKAALERLRANQAVIGIIQTMPVATITEIAVWSGYDFVVIDCEHGLMDEPAQVGCLQAMTGTGAISGVRVRPGDVDAVGRYLDYGFDAVLMPNVHNATEAAAFVAAATTGPKGKRGSTSATRASRYGMSKAANATPLLITLIESAEAVADIKAIAATPGISGLVVGPNDLAADLECVGNYAAPVYGAALEAIEQAAKAAGLFYGTRPHPEYPASRLFERGHRFMIAGADIGALRAGFATELGAMRKVAELG